MYYYMFGGIGLLVAVWAAASYLAVRNLEEPAYTVLSKRNGYEIRQYQPYIVAEATVKGDYRESLSQGFRLIADYIFGNNTTRQSITMTTPVLETLSAGQSEKIAMTVPVLAADTNDDARTIAFVLPSAYTLDTLPTPNNSRVSLRAVPTQKAAVLRFTWYATPARVAAKKEQLHTLLTRDGIETTGSVRSALYNPPLSLPLMLRNEIIAPLVE